MAKTKKKQVLEKLNEVRNLIFEAIPEILEVKFGCKLSYDNSDNPETKELIYVWEDPNGDTDYSNTVTAYSPKLDKIVMGNAWAVTNYAVRGRTIRLADVFLSFVRHEKNLASEMYLMILSMWDLSKDDLELQEPNTIEFLHNLFSKG